MSVLLGRLGRDVVRLLLPNACVACGLPGTPDQPDTDQLFCRACRSRLVPVVPGCRRCAQPLPPVGPCRFCAAWVALAQCRSAVWLGPGARLAVHSLKYGGLTGLAEPLADVIVHRVPRPRGVLVPVPLARARLRARGFNQAACLARALAGRWRLPVAEGALVRWRETRTQTALEPAARAANVDGAFRAAANPRGGPVILVDDVLTTGATLLAAAATLGTAGWGPIDAVTFARAEPWGRRIIG